MYNYHLGLTPLKIGRLSLQSSCVFVALQRCEAPAFCHSKIGALGRHAGPSCSSTSNLWYQRCCDLYHEISYCKRRPHLDDVYKFGTETKIKRQKSKMIRWIRWKITMIGKADLMTNTAETKTAWCKAFTAVKSWCRSDHPIIGNAEIAF